jgi:hypothetical protein
MQRAFDNAFSLQDLVKVADNSLARPVRNQVTATEDVDVHMSHLKS